MKSKKSSIKKKIKSTDHIHNHHNKISHFFYYHKIPIFQIIIFFAINAKDINNLNLKISYTIYYYINFNNKNNN
jgi:hypothetical protein